MNRFTTKQLELMLEAQAGLNVKYTGENWANIVPMSSFGAATMAELGELLESSPRIGDNEAGWKWWKPYLENDDNNVKVEIIDIIHFTLSMLIMAYETPAEVIEVYKNNALDVFAPDEPQKMEYMLGAVSGFVVNSSSLDYHGFIIDFTYMIDSLCHFNGMSTDEMFEIYAKKNALNAERVAGGYMESADAYQKYDEDGNEDNTKMFKD